jgi:predicted  nucleic acid-binding Zn-ribbon protein
VKKLSEQLKMAVRDMAYRTSVDQLKKRGVTQVNMLSMDRIVALIDEAVHRAVRHHLIGSEREQVIDATKEEFLNLMRNHEALENEASELRKLQTRAQDELDMLRRELGQAQQTLEAKLAAAAVPAQVRIEGENADLAKRFYETFATLKDMGLGDFDQLRDGALAILLEFVAKERKATIAATEAARDNEIDLLQRRVAKLSTSLEESEKRMVEIAALKNIDPGISSIYRDVQGLSAEDVMYKKKTALMSDIFKANLALQKKS